MTTRTYDGFMIEPGSTTERYNEDERVHLCCCIERGLAAGSCYTPRAKKKRTSQRIARRTASQRLPMPIPA